MDPLDAIVGAGVGFEKTPALTRCLQQPGKGISHNLFAVVAGPLEDLNPMCVGLVFLLAAERTHHSQVGYQGRYVARARDNLIEDKNTDVHAGPYSLSFRDVAEISVRHLVGQDAAQVVVACLLQEAGRDIEVATAGIGGIDLWIIQNGHAHLIQLEWMVHVLDEGHHHPLEPFGLACVNLASAGRLLSACRRIPSSCSLRRSVGAAHVQKHQAHRHRYRHFPETS